VTNAPTFGRNALLVNRLVAGAVPVTAADGHNPMSSGFGPSNVSFNGTPAQGNSIMVNGVVNQYGNGSISFVPAKDSVQEVVVQTFALSAEYGQTAGGVISIETKSGSNALHGAGYYHHAQAGLNARDFFVNRFNRPKPVNRRNMPGGNIGGPVYLPHLYNGRNRTFFFFDYEGARDLGQAAFLNTVPTQLERGGDFSQTLGANGQVIRIFDPYSSRFDTGNTVVRDPLPLNVVPRSRHSPIALNALKWVPLPNLPGTANNMQYNSPQPNGHDALSFRLDERLSDKDTLYFTLARQKYNLTWFGSVPTGINGYRNDRWDKLATVGYTRVFGPATVFNLRAGVQQNNQDIVPHTTPKDLQDFGFPQSFLSSVQYPSTPRIASSDMVSIGDWNRGTSFYTPNLRAFLTKAIGRHSLTSGYEFRVNRTFDYNHLDEAGFFNFTRSWTQGPNAATASANAGYGVATLLLGTPSSGSLAINTTTAAQQLYSGLYIQDNWRITQKLTINLGLRWDVQNPVTERFNRMNRGFDTTVASPIAAQAEANYARNPFVPELQRLNLKGGLLFAGNGGQPRQGFNTAKDQFQPRAGIAWQFVPGTVLRIGYGMFYMPFQDMRNPNIGQTTLPLTQNGYAASTAMRTTLGVLPLDTLANPFPQGVVQPIGSSLGLSTLLGQSITATTPMGSPPAATSFRLVYSGNCQDGFCSILHMWAAESRSFRSTKTSMRSRTSTSHCATKPTVPYRTRIRSRDSSRLARSAPTPSRVASCCGRSRTLPA
jgi:outer membrane receptor protein involved in Fe transport